MFDSFLPQGSETDTKERRESYDKAVVESAARMKDKAEADRRSLEDKRWLKRFKRVWEDGKQTGGN